MLRIARWAALLAPVAIAFIALPDVSLSGDGATSVRCAILRETGPSCALTSWLQIGAASAFGDPVLGVRAVSWVAGLVGVGCGVALARTLFDDGPGRVAAAFLFLTTANAALWFGSLEVYAPIGAAVLAYLLVVARAMKGVGSPVVPPIVLGAAFALHGSAGLLLPSLAWWAWESGGADGRLGRVLRAGALFLVPVAATFAALYFIVWRGTPPPPGAERWGTFLGAEGHGPILRPRLGPGDVGSRYALFDAEHALGALGTIFVAAPAAWAVLVALGPMRRRDNAPDEVRRRLIRFAVAALVPWLVYASVWNVSYELRRDWDMFTPLGAIVAFLASIVVLRDRGNRATSVGTAALCLFSFVPFVISHAGGDVERRAFAMHVAETIELANGKRHESGLALQVERWDEETRRLDASGAAARIDEGDALGARGDLPGAARKYADAVAAEPTNPVARYCHGMTLLRSGRRDDARSELTSAVSVRDVNCRVLARDALGRMAIEDGDLDEAIRQLTRSLRESSWVPEAPQAARDLAKAWRGKGRADVADDLERWADDRSR